MDFVNTRVISRGKIEMKQIIQSYKTGKVELKEVPIPLCKDNGVLVRTLVSLVSAGTEKAVIGLGKKSLIGKAKERPDLVKQIIGKVKEEGIIAITRKVFAKLDSPVVLGYSCSGEIIEVGKNVDEFRKADRVACAGAGYASHAEVNFVPKNLCVKIPENVSFEEASFVTLGAIAMQGIRRCELKPGERVAVIGLGLLGQLSVQILCAYGFPVMGMDIDKRKVDKGLKLGLDRAAVIGKDKVEEIAYSFSEGYGLDAVIITASTKSNEPVELAGKICRQRGRVVAVGLVGMEIPRDIYYEKELDFRISRSYGPGRYDSNYEEKGQDYPYAYVRWTERRNMEEFLRLISVGRANVKEMITHKFKLEDYNKAYGLILKNPNNEDYAGILLEYDTTKEHKSVIVLSGDKQKKKLEESINVGLIGGGDFAKSIILPNLKKLKKVNIRAVATASGKSAQNIGQKYKCQYCTTDYTQILDDRQINTVFIATRHNLHAQITIEALKKNKNVFVEKPLCINEKDLKEIIYTINHGLSAMNHQPILMVGFNRRFSHQAIKAKKQFSNHSTPLMINYRVNAGYIPRDNWVHDSEEGGGRIIGEVCHFVDLLQFLIGAPPVKVYATRLPSKAKVLADDNVNIVIDFSDGSRGNILYTALGDKALGKEYIEIFGNRTSFVIDDFKNGIFGLSQDKGHLAEFKAFIEAILNGKSSPIPINEILLTTLTTFRVYDSLRIGIPAKIDLS